MHGAVLYRYSTTVRRVHVLYNVHVRTVYVQYSTVVLCTVRTVARIQYCMYVRTVYGQIVSFWRAMEIINQSLNRKW